MNRHSQRLAAIALLAIGVGAALAQPSTTQPAFSAEAYLAHLKFLASDELQGRAPGTEGSAKAAEYIIAQYKAAGCQPAGTEGWLQPFEVRNGKRIEDHEASFRIDGVSGDWQLRRDWIPFPFSEYGDIEGPLAFAGYGIRAKKFGYDDYADFDAEGKVLLIFRYEPRADDPDADFGGETPSRHALFVRKVNLAAKQGAKALLVVNPPSHDPDRDVLYPFTVFNSQPTYQLPMVHISRKLATAILSKAGLPDLATLEKQLKEHHGHQSRDLDLQVHIRTGLKPNMITAANILALVPGDGSTDEYIVVGAHRDHLGLVPRQFQSGDQTPVIHNGADDNASGTAFIIELAKAAARGPTLRRNVLFISFDAEEMGLVGSRYFVNHPTVPLEKIRAMLNFDMVGRLNLNKYSVFGTSSAVEFEELVDRYNEQAGLDCRLSSGMVGGGSDHAPFLRKHIPALFAFTGMHRQYHRPEDDWELIDAPGAARLLSLWYPLMCELANMTDGPTYQATTPTEEPEEDLPKPASEEAAEKTENGSRSATKKPRRDDAAPTGRTQIKVSLRIIPDMVGDDKPGMLIDTAIPGGPAAKAGLKDGDRIIRIGDMAIRDIYAYMQALEKYEPGDKVNVVVERDGKQLTFTVTLQKSRYRKQQD